MAPGPRPVGPGRKTWRARQVGKRRTASVLPIESCGCVTTPPCFTLDFMNEYRRPTPKHIIEVIDTAIEDFHGDVKHLEQAIGAWLVGQHFGWKALYLMHDRKTMKRAQDILGVNFQSELPEVGERAEKSAAWLLFAKKDLKSFWKAVKGEIPGIKSAEVK